MNGNGRSGGRPTLEEVAVRAGVGRGTVSRVINGSSKVSEQTKAAVEAAVTELGYVPNRAARALAANRNDAIALVIPEPEARFFAEPYFSEVVRGVGAALAETDIQLVLTLAGSDRERRRLAQYLSGHRVDGVLLVSVHAGDPLPELLAELGIPTVISGRRSAAETLPCVDSDNLAGAAEAVRHLLDRGRRTIATITGPLDVYGAHCRLDGYREALTAAGRPVDERLVAVADFTEEGAAGPCGSCWNAAPRSTRSSPPPTSWRRAPGGSCARPGAGSRTTWPWSASTTRWSPGTWTRR